MSTTEHIKEIQHQINELRKKQTELQDKAGIESIAEIRQMNWLKGKKVRFDHGLAAVGLAEYKLMLDGDIPLLNDVLGAGRHVCLYGEDKFYENNIILRKGEDWGFTVYSMETSNGETLAKFIKENGLKIEGFSKKRQAVYKAILENLAD